MPNTPATVEMSRGGGTSVAASDAAAAPRPSGGRLLGDDAQMERIAQLARFSESSSAPPAADAHHHDGCDSDVLLDSLQPPRLYASVFVWQFVLHMVPPLLLFYPRRFRPHGPRNQVLVGARALNPFFIYFQYVTLVVLWVNLALFFAFRDEFRRDEARRARNGGSVCCWWRMCEREVVAGVRR